MQVKLLRSLPSASEFVSSTPWETLTPSLAWREWKTTTARYREKRGPKDHFMAQRGPQGLPRRWAFRKTLSLLTAKYAANLTAIMAQIERQNETKQSN
jgi:hypothetical protein